MKKIKTDRGVKKQINKEKLWRTAQIRKAYILLKRRKNENR